MENVNNNQQQDSEHNKDLEGNIQLYNNSDQVQHFDYKQHEQQHQEISDINIQGSSPLAQGINTLNEPVYITILRDLRMIWYKIKFVMTLRLRQDDGKSQLKSWDLWGPLLLCLILGLSLSIAANTKESRQSDLIFSIIFVVVWIGGGVVTINAKLLKGQISFFQSVCVLGYCTCPITIFSFLIAIISVIPSYISLLMLLVGFVWSTYASYGLMSTLVQTDKKYLAVYPLFLFYLFLFWFSYVTLTMNK